MAASDRTTDEVAYDWFGETVWSTLLKEDIKLRKLIVKGGLADWLIVVSVYHEDEYRVGFVGAPTLLDAIKKFRRNLKDGTMVWKEDKFAPE